MNLQAITSRGLSDVRKDAYTLVRGQNISTSGAQERPIPGLPALAGSKQFRHDIEPLPLNRQPQVISRVKEDLPYMRLSSGDFAFNRNARRERSGIFVPLR